MSSPADAEHGVDDLTHYMQATARMRERAEQAEAQLERLRQRMTAHRETYVAAIAGSEKEIQRLRQQNAALREVVKQHVGRGHDQFAELAAALAQAEHGVQKGEAR